MSDAQFIGSLLGAIGVMGTAIGILWRAHVADLKETIALERARNAKLDEENDGMMDMLRNIVAMLETAERERERSWREGGR